MSIDLTTTGPSPCKRDLYSDDASRSRSPSRRSYNNQESKVTYCDKIIIGGIALIALGLAVQYVGSHK